MKTSNEQSQELLSPILAVFSGEDGGIAFTNLRHKYLVQWIETAHDDTSSAELVKIVEKFSNLCKFIQK